MNPGAGRFTVALLILGTMAGCTQVAEVSRPGFDPRQYSTFAFVPRPDPAVEGTNDSTERIRQAVVRELQAKGYRAASTRRASFVVSFHTNLAGPLDPADLGYTQENWEREGERAIATDETHAATTARDRWEIGKRPDRGRYVNMLVVIDAVDQHAHDLIWRGWARSKTPPSAVSFDELAEVAADVLSQFPAR